MKLTISLLSLVLALFFTGCASVKQPLIDPVTIRAVAGLGTEAALSQKPQLRPDFVVAHEALGIIVEFGTTNNAVTVDQINSLVDQFRKNTNNATVNLAINSGITLYNIYVQQNTSLPSLQQATNALAAVDALYLGIGDGLGGVAIKLPQ